MYAHDASSSHIPRPPHSAGLSYTGLRAAIDPHQIPSPVEVIETDKETWERTPFTTLPGSHVPLSTTDYAAIDQGNSSPKFIRVSTWNIPSTSRLASECHIPLAAIMQPFADLDPREEPVPLVDTGEAGPARCAKCRGYINAWCTWAAGGARWKCNLCSHETEVHPDYYCGLDANLSRLDLAQRPELFKGTVDFTVSQEYWAPHPPPRISPLYQPIFPDPPTGHRIPQPMDYLFILEISTEAICSGFVKSACESISRILYGSSPNDEIAVEGCFPSGSRICIFTYDTTLHFYDLSPSLDTASMLVVSDLDDVFVPTSQGLFVDPVESRPLIEKLLMSLSHRGKYDTYPETALGSALVGGLAALAGRGGQIVAFACTLPTIGHGALKPRVDESTLYDTEKESTLFLPRDDTWEDIAEQCSEEGVGVSMFLGMPKYIDVGSIGVVASGTGGELYFHPRFDPSRDSVALDSQLRRLVTRTTVYNAVMRVRCSYGLRISKAYGNYYENPASDLEFGVLDADKAISVVLEHARNLDDRQYAYLQSAVLYTTVDGQRRVRTCNVALQVASLAGNVFRYADMDATVCHMLREAVARLPHQKISYIQEELTEKCASILLGYRRNCAAATAPSQLIIPEAFRALPVYTLSMMKTKPLKARNVTSDVRNVHAHKILGMGVRCTIQHIYPRLMAIHDLHETIAVPDPDTGFIDFPTLMRDSYLFMAGHGVYLIDNEDVMILWIGASVSPQLLTDLFGVEDINDVNRDIAHLPRVDSLLSTQVRNILAHRQLQRGGRTPKFIVSRQNMDGSEIDFSDLLVEDQNNAAMSYLDYLCLVHKQINIVLTGGGTLSGSSTLRGSPW